MRHTSSLRTCQPPVYHSKMGESRFVPFPTAQQVNCRLVHFTLSFPCQTSNREAVNTNFKVIGLTRLGIKSKSTAPEVDALTPGPSELLSRIKWADFGWNMELSSFLNCQYLSTMKSKYHFGQISIRCLSYSQVLAAFFVIWMSVSWKDCILAYQKQKLLSQW